jgi:hypothetical protein
VGGPFGRSPYFAKASKVGDDRRLQWRPCFAGVLRGGVWVVRAGRGEAGGWGPFCRSAYFAKASKAGDDQRSRRGRDR